MSILEGVVKSVSETETVIRHVLHPWSLKLHLGDKVVIQKQVDHRTIKQNDIYQSLLNFVILKFGKDIGMFSTAALHENIKAYIQSENYPSLLDEMRGTSDPEFSTRLISKGTFGLFLDIVCNDILLEIYKIDTSKFWEEYDAKYKGTGRR